MNKETQLEVMPGGSRAVAPVEPQGVITIESAFNAAASKALDKDSLAVMERLLAMDGERKFNASFAKLQSELPTIVASSIIPNRGKYERFEDVMRQIGKPLSENGFSIKFSQDYHENKIVVTCELRHAGGHKELNRYAVRVSGKADSETQADCKASTTAKRNALLQALNIVIRQDCLNEENDPHMEGNPDAFVTQAVADELERRVKELNGDVPRFLAFAGAKKFSEIRASKYDMLDSSLRDKAKGSK
jgi:hypothetical protein